VRAHHGTNGVHFNGYDLFVGSTAAAAAAAAAAAYVMTSVGKLHSVAANACENRY
jgi:hypothetical protein